MFAVLYDCQVDVKLEAYIIQAFKVCNVPLMMHHGQPSYVPGYCFKTNIVKACGQAVKHRSSTAMLEHVVEWPSTDRAQPIELLSVMTSTEGAQ